MKLFIPLSIEDLNTLLINQSLIKDIALVKSAPQRHICTINDCLWQGTDTFDLDNHVEVYHGSDLELEDYMLQIVISEDELEELAVRGLAVIEGTTFQIMQPLRFRYGIGGGRWYSNSEDFIYNRATKGTAREAELLKQIQGEKRKHVEALARNQEIIRALENNQKLALAEIDQLKQELAEAKTSAQIFCDAVEVGVQEPESQMAGASADFSALEDINSKLETSNTKLETQIQSVSEVLGRGVLVWAEEHTKDRQIIEILKMEISKLCREIRQKDDLMSDAISIHKRFLVYAREGMIDRTKTTYQRSPEVAAIISKGNDVAHRANFYAHLSLYNGGHLSSNDIVTLEKMYDLPPAAWETSLISPKSVEMWNMMGTMAATLARIKFRPSMYSRLYQDFLVLCRNTSSIRIMIEKEKGINGDARTAFDEHEEVLANLKKMKTILDQFTQQDKMQRSSQED